MSFIFSPSLNTSLNMSLCIGRYHFEFEPQFEFQLEQFQSQSVPSSHCSVFYLWVQLPKMESGSARLSGFQVGTGHRQLVEDHRLSRIRLYVTIEGPATCSRCVGVLRLEGPRAPLGVQSFVNPT
ncbi:unnamed protein product [Nesidiocoris tenuis]|uniref:Uncharacterized protein n=1 Tax=Nesidiocoris tenuis TaxID=355587 RepID=A0A6H5HFE0_9HEMI|nr:unnamed protein product [Nesidiocoris tenuis]